MTKPDTERVGAITIRRQVLRREETGRWAMDIPAEISGCGRRVRRRKPSKSAAKAEARHIALARELKEEGGAPCGRTLNDLFPFWYQRERRKVEAGKKRLNSLQTDIRSLKHVLDFL